MNRKLFTFIALLKLDKVLKIILVGKSCIGHFMGNFKVNNGKLNNSKKVNMPGLSAVERESIKRVQLLFLSRISPFLSVKWDKITLKTFFFAFFAYNGQNK